MSPHEYCRSRALQSGSSFYYSFLFLPEEQRRAITALYAFCREVDDVVDELTDRSVARVKLAWWRTEVDAVYGGSPQHPVARALLDVVPACRVASGKAHKCNKISDLPLASVSLDELRSESKHLFQGRF